jgi:hypothetical protein
MTIKRQSLSRFTPLTRGLAGAKSRKLQNMRVGRFGAASRGRRLSAHERLAAESQLRQDGKI